MRTGCGNVQVDPLADATDWSDLSLPALELVAEAPHTASASTSGTASLVPATPDPTVPAWVKDNRWLRCFVPQPLATQAHC